MRAYLLWLSILVTACGGSDLKRVGESCTASSECGTGLLCDMNAEPHVCSNMGSLDAPAAIDAPVGHHPDGHLIVDAPPIDAPPIDAPVDSPLD